MRAKRNKRILEIYYYSSSFQSAVPKLMFSSNFRVFYLFYIFFAAPGFRPSGIKVIFPVPSIYYYFYFSNNFQSLWDIVLSLHRYPAGCVERTAVYIKYILYNRSAFAGSQAIIKSHEKIKNPKKIRSCIKPHAAFVQTTVLHFNRIARLP